MKPSDRYAADVEAGQIERDPAQVTALARLDDLHARLINRPVETPGLWSRLWGRRPRPAPERGLYLWGGVGRGKTYLMDLFFACVPGERKLRLHFHRFMRRVHRDLTALAGTPNPLSLVADRFADETDLLCFDEFFVSDIGDAMILAELLKHLFDRGVTLVATSNIEPAGLYENGLQRRRFLPAIALLEAHTEIFNLDSPLDYRLRALEQAEIYHAPLDAAAEESLQKSFDSLISEHPAADLELEIEGRLIPSRWHAEDVVWFEFQAICGGPRSQNDYIEIAREYHAVLVSGVPRFDEKIEDQARRFIALVDEFYDHNVKLILSAAVPLVDLYRGAKLRFEFERTVSRLLEMQSHDYLARTHQG